jgi:hypothetical protein
MSVEADEPDLDTPADAGDEVSDDAIWAEFAAEEKGDTPEPKADKPADPVDNQDHDEPPAGKDTGTDKADTPETRIKALEEQNQRLEHALKSEVGRNKAKTREVETLRARIALNRDAVTRAQAAAKSDQAKAKKLDGVAAEYPEVAAPLVAELKELKAAKTADTAAKQAQIRADEQALHDTIVAEQTVFLEEHPDGIASIKENKAVFKSWIEDQPKRVRDAYAANRTQITDGQSAAMLVSRFKLALAEAASKAPAKTEEQKRLDAKRQKQLAGAQSTKSGSAPRATTTPGDSASHEDLWAYWASKEK